MSCAYEFDRQLIPTKFRAPQMRECAVAGIKPPVLLWKKKAAQQPLALIPIPTTAATAATGKLGKVATVAPVKQQT